MVKEMVMLKKKEGISNEDFVRKYEDELVPLMLKLCPAIKKYVRNYVRTPLTAPDRAALPFDCITEVWYEDMDAFKALAELAMSEEGKVIFDLAGTFTDTSKMVAVLVKETES